MDVLPGLMMKNAEVILNWSWRDPEESGPTNTFWVGETGFARAENDPIRNTKSF